MCAKTSEPLKTDLERSSQKKIGGYNQTKTCFEPCSSVQRNRESQLLANQTTDPDVRLVLHAVDLIERRIGARVDRYLQQEAQAIANLFNPGTLDPVPSFAMLQVDPVDSELPNRINRQTPLLLVASGEKTGSAAKFTPCCDFEPLPLTVEDASWSSLPSDLESGYGLRIQLQCDGHVPEPIDNEVDFRIGISAEHVLASEIYSAIASPSTKALLFEGEHEVYAIDLKPFGFDESEQLLPFGNHLHRGERLMREYFLFPEKFLGFSVQLPAGVSLTELVIWIVPDGTPAHIDRVSKSCFSNQCFSGGQSV